MSGREEQRIADPENTLIPGRGTGSNARAPRLVNLLLVVLSVSAALVALEVILRLTQPARPVRREPQVKYIHVPRDPLVGRVSDYHYLLPNQRGYHFGAPVSVNALGLRNPPVQLEKPPGAHRILALGDSHTFGFAVENRETWPQLLQDRISLSTAKATGQIEVINAGIEGLSLAQEVQFLRERLLQLKPDVVVLAYYWNDMPMDGGPFDPLDGDPVPPSKAPVADQGEERATGALQRIGDYTRRALKGSHLFYSVVQRIPYLQLVVFPADETRWKRALLEGRTSKRIEASWSSVERGLAELHDLGEQEEFQLLVLAIPLFEQMVSRSPSLESYQAQLSRICKRHGIRFLDPLEAIRALNPSYPKHFIPFDGHPNGLIYEVIADEVFKFLRRERLVRSRPQVEYPTVVWAG